MSRAAASPSSYPTGDAGEILRIFDAATQPVLGNPAVWAEERARVDAPDLPWPLKRTGKDYERLMRHLVERVVDNVLDAMRQDTLNVVTPEGIRVRVPNTGARGFAAVPAQNPKLADFQIVLRVVKRATDTAEAALSQRFGGTGRISTRRDMVNYLKRMEAERAIRSGLPRDEAFRKAGLARSTAYRVLGRKR